MFSVIRNKSGRFWTLGFIIIVGVFLGFLLMIPLEVNGDINESRSGFLSAADSTDPKSNTVFPLRPNYDTINSQILIAELYDSAGMIGKNVLITCGGMGAKLRWVERWTRELYIKKLKDYNIGLVCIIEGPREEYYDSRDILIQNLTKKYIDTYQKYNLNETLCIAHSSGVFPAHQMFDLLYDGGIDSNSSKKDIKANSTKRGKHKRSHVQGDHKNSVLVPYDSLGITRNKISYIMLDGELGIPKGYTLTERMVKNLKHIYSVYAIDEKTGTRSGLYHEAIKVKQSYPDKTTDFLVRSQNSGCRPNAKWCVHETVITTIPHNPSGYDLEKDYQYFDSNRQVVFEYMDSVSITIK